MRALMAALMAALVAVLMTAPRATLAAATAAARAAEVVRAAERCLQDAREGRECAPGVALELAAVAAEIHYAGDLEAARVPYERVLQVASGGRVRAVVLNNLGRVESDLGDQSRALALLEQCEREFPFAEGVAWHRELHSNLWNNIGLVHHRRGRAHEAEAKAAYERAIELDPLLNEGEVWFNLGVSSKNLGLHEDALRAYERALELNPTLVSAMINVAALFHEHQMLPEAVARYQQVIELSEPDSEVRRMALMNLGTAFTELGDASRAVASYLRSLQEASAGSARDDLELHVRASVAVARRIGCDWTAFDLETVWLEREVDERELRRGRAPSLLPFDTLLRDFAGDFRLRLAAGHAAQYGPPGPRPQMARTGERVRVGYFSYDFNDHPTAHLCEDLFDLHELHRRVDAVILSFGKDDGSAFRKRIEKAGSHFEDLSATAHAESVRVIRDDLNVEILMDMQGFTRGGRPEIVVARPAPVIVNYLVYAGTSGAAFVDYFIGDNVASPLAELAPQFSEKLVLLPHCYQVNTYAKTLGSSAVAPGEQPAGFCDRFDEIAGASFIFANFNKNDKHEPLSFEAWMQILRRVPGSVLWLLEPSRRLAPALTRDNLVKQARARGVDPSRLRFARRMPKADHVARHECADLFLDTLVYGAHSTATDALRGGLPVLTVAGGAFASRVAASLLSALGVANVLVTHSVKDFIDTAVSVAERPGVAEGLKRRVQAKVRAGSPLFDVDTHTVHLEHAFRAMVDLRLLEAERHILVRSAS